MGAWGVGVLQGDTPLDILYDIGLMIGEESLYPVEFDDETNARIAEKLAQKQAEIMKKLGMMAFGRRETMPVLAAIIMVTGATMLDEVREAAVEAAEANAENAEDWIDPNERATYMRNFAAAIRAYKPGERFKLNDKGLFETLAEGLAGGQTIH